MRHIKTIPDDDLGQMVAMLSNAYPGMKIFTPEEQEQHRERSAQRREDPTLEYYGVYDAAVMVGTMTTFDFTVNVHGCEVPVGGVGSVAVDLLHKKEHVAKDMLAFFINHYHERGCPMTMLYPFRADFYKKMGYGYGTPSHLYRILPGALPRSGAKANVRFLNEDDQDAILACYDTHYRQTHGLCKREWWHILYNMLHNKKRRLAGYFNGDSLEGYLYFGFEKPPGIDNFLMNDLVVFEFVYNSPAALAGLMTFLHTQFDQVNRVVLSTQDPGFYFMLSDYRDDSNELWPIIAQQSHITSIGLMYRVSDVAGIFRALAAHDFNGQTLRLKITVRDSFFPANDGSTVIAFEQGRARIAADGAHDVEIALDVSEFSSLLMGCVNFKRLLMFGLATISDASCTDTVERIFYTPEKPICLTPF